MHDFAIYGSGFASYSIAATALEAGCRVLVVEKGPRADFSKSVALSQVVSLWEPVESAVKFPSNEYGLHAKTPPHFIALGGTSRLWSGKWRRLDKVDFIRAREGRCWPFNEEELSVHYQAVTKRFGFSQKKSASAEIRKHVAAVGLRLVSTTLSDPVRLAEKWARLVSEYSKLTIFCDVHRIDFRLNRGTIEDALIHGSNGFCKEVGAKHHVIAAGGIASAGLVRELYYAATGTSQPFLGGYMDHPKGEAGIIWPTKNLEVLEALLSTKDVRFGFSLPEDELLQGGIGNHVAFLQAPAVNGSLRYNPLPLQLTIHVEQFPENCNGIQYAPTPAVRWKISADTRRNVDLFLRTLQLRMKALFGRCEFKSWVDLRAASHPCGCTPLSQTPGTCHLDPSGRLHRLKNAYCISSSAFPISGSANPTMTIAALGNKFVRDVISSM